jgi:surface polysaccharide O-acyltransferase-like enzyme
VQNNAPTFTIFSDSARMVPQSSQPEVPVTYPAISQKAEERFIWLDSLRLAAGVSMVGLHSSSDSMGEPFAAFAPAERVLPMLLRAVIYTARTELFLIISIFLLLMALDRHPKSYVQTILIQMRRLLLPFLFWTVFYAFYNLIKANAFDYAPAVERELRSPAAWIGFVLLGSVKYHMHFIPTLFGLILMYPLFRLAKTFPVLGLFVFVCLLIKRDLDGFLYQQFWGSDVLPYMIRIVKIATYAGYGLMAGAFLGIWQKTTPAQRQQFVSLIIFFGAMLFCIKLVATWKTVYYGKWPFDYTAGYWADFLMPIVLFVLAMSLGHKRWPVILSQLAPYSFGIYLCHPIFLDLMEIWIQGRDISPIGQVMLKIVCATTATSLLVMIIKQNRLLAWTIGLGAFPKLATLQVQKGNS